MIKASSFYRGFILLAFVGYIFCFVLAVIFTSENYWDGILKALATPISFTIFIAFFAVAFALENYLRKTDLNISGKVELHSNEATKSGCSYDVGVANFELNNYKDKTVVIYRVYLYLKEGFYIELLNSKKKPILLKAYDTYYQDFKRPLYYMLDNDSKTIQNVEFSKAKLYLDTNEGRYRVKKSIENWNPDIRKTLIPKTSENDYDFNVKFYFQARSFLSVSLQDTINRIEYNQDVLILENKEIDISSIHTIEDLRNLLNKESPVMKGYHIWSPIEDVKNKYPDWDKREQLNFADDWMKGIRKCLNKARFW
ncbi:hypothetical protein [Acinetobacter terrae]|uniref:Uncharacterized protein n=1 Tax=Acinetobacter terrae TaxID=2731247 RepID=A0A4R0EMG5_9GAMM|nr:hypothetical protein [Acinetobacter terrae]TCB59600.1 hypothetical protein E0H85_07195 [Acinetobacter terrae]